MTTMMIIIKETWKEMSTSVSSSDNDISTDFDDEEFDQDHVYHPPAYHSKHNIVDKLPPLFKCIKTYNDA